MIADNPQAPATAQDQSAITDHLLLLRRYRDLEDEESLAIIRQDFRAANRLLRFRLEIKARLLLDDTAEPGRS